MYLFCASLFCCGYRSQTCLLPRSFAFNRMHKCPSYLWGQCCYLHAATLFSSDNVHALTHISQNCELFLPFQITMLIPFMSYETSTTKRSSSFEEFCALFWRKTTQIIPQPRYSLQQHFAHIAESKSLLMQNSSGLQISFTRNIT